MRTFFAALAVKDVKKSMQFFSKLGFEFNSKFTDDKAACMVVNDNASVMMLSEESFKSFSHRPVADAWKTTEGLFTFSCNSRAEVDELAKKALDAGATQADDKEDHGFMYSWSFFDLDGHSWQVMWMDPKGR